MKKQSDPTVITSKERERAEKYIILGEGILPKTTLAMLNGAMKTGNRRRLREGLRLAERYDKAIEANEAETAALQAMYAEETERTRKANEADDQFVRGMIVAEKLRDKLRELSDMVAMDKRGAFERFLRQIDDLEFGENRLLAAWIKSARQRIDAYTERKRQRDLAQNHKAARGQVSYV